MKTIHELLKGMPGCACGKNHLCPVEHIIVRKDALSDLPELCAPYRHILPVADENTWRICGEKACGMLAGLIDPPLILKNEGNVVIPNEQAIAEIEARINPDTDLLLGFGSGVINDLCKHTSFLHDLPYFIAATAPSMDGFVSVGAALILGGMKITLNARPPKAVIADTDVLCNAPMDMIRSGWGDIIGKYSCLNDWKLSALLYGEYFCREVWNLVDETVKNLEPLAESINARDPQAVGLLMEALITVGIAMSYVGNSRPASGSEHHLSHFFEITGILNHAPYFPHGTDVLYSAVVTAELREEILNRTPSLRPFDRTGWESEIRRIYSTSADGILSLQNKLGWYERDDSAVVASRWEQVRALLAEAPGKEKMLALTEAIGLPFKDFLAMYGSERIRDGIRYAKDLKDRWTVLWLYDRYFV